MFTCTKSEVLASVMGWVGQVCVHLAWACFFTDLTPVCSSFHCGFRVKALNEWANLHKGYRPRCVTAASLASADSQQGLHANPLPSLNWISALILPGQS